MIEAHFPWAKARRNRQLGGAVQRVSLGGLFLHVRKTAADIVGVTEMPPQEFDMKYFPVLIINSALADGSEGWSASQLHQHARDNMGNALTKEDRALLERASEMFEETGCVPGFNGEEVAAETIVPDAKEYIWEMINDRKLSTTRRYGIHLGLRWSFRGWHKNGIEDVANSHRAARRAVSST